MENKISESDDSITKLDAENDESGRKYTEMKDALTTDITAVMKKHSMLQSTQDRTVLELKQRTIQLQTMNAKTEELNSRFALNSENYHLEISQLKEDLQRKASEVAQLQRDKAEKKDNLKQSKAECDMLELALGDQKWKNDLVIGDHAHAVRRLEESKRTIETDLAAKQQLLVVQTAECHNMNIAHSETRNHSLRHQADSTPKAHLRSVITSNQDLTKSYDDMILQKDAQNNEICAIRKSVLDLERRLRDTHESFINKDVN